MSAAIALKSPGQQQVWGVPRGDEASACSAVEEIRDQQGQMHWPCCAATARLAAAPALHPALHLHCTSTWNGRAWVF
jgi:hypothetical protein